MRFYSKEEISKFPYASCTKALDALKGYESQFRKKYKGDDEAQEQFDDWVYWLETRIQETIRECHEKKRKNDIRVQAFINGDDKPTNSEIEKIRHEEEEILDRVRSKRGQSFDSNQNINVAGEDIRTTFPHGEFSGCGTVVIKEAHVPSEILTSARINNRRTNIDLLALGKPGGDIFNENHWMHESHKDWFYSVIDWREDMVFQ